ncbi:MAG: TonB-dependent receptor [Saprospiraceae bacterium]|nr:TonB-dependent receptor [Saprospiraceae bacterium]
MNYLTRSTILYFLLFNFLLIPVISGQEIDTLWQKEIEQVTILSYKLQIEEVKNLEKVHETYIISGKKNEVISVQNLPSNIAEKTGRQIFAKIPGAFIYDMDGSGNQVNLATRGLDPHRSWEYNIRQNGIMTNSDIYGYPASHYSPPMEAIQKIELIRGSASLQFGAQFGGMINYITKQADTTKTLSVENINTIGSFGLLSNYLSAGGKKGKLTYFGYYQRRISNGYRDHASSDSDAQFLSIGYELSKNLTLKAELGRSSYLHRNPGPLTDKMFAENPRQATRTRNYFSPDIYVPSLSLDWIINKNTRIQWITSAVLGTRSSVQFIGFADARDTINLMTGQYRNRQVDIDNFNSYTSEIRWLQQYKLFSLSSTFVSGVRYINNDLHRRQQGKGTTGTDFDLRVEGNFGRDIHLKTNNIAIFAENLTRITSKWDLTLGIRYENGISKMSGNIVYLPEEDTRKSIKHQFPLYGAGMTYELDNNHKMYTSFSQAYRPVIFSDLIPATVLEKTDPNLQNALGHNFEIGVKGKLWNRITYDINYFQIRYNNRIGNLILTDDNQQSYIWRTNIGDSNTKGLECYLEAILISNENMKVSAFTATSYFEGKYLNGQLRQGSENVDLTGNVIETVPEWTSRNGIQLAYKRTSVIIQHSYVSETFSDALNTETPTANGGVGIVPSYNLWDINAAFRIHKNITFRCGVHNLTNQSYFTKRPTVYPGPGVWSSDGIGFTGTVIVQI